MKGVFKEGNRIEQWRELGLLSFILLISAGVQLRNPAFLTIDNLMTLLTHTSILGILAVGMMLVLVTGGIDLSIGSTIAFSGMITAITVSMNPNMPAIGALVEGTAVGALIGIIIGGLVARFEILPIIATLGMMNVVRGLTYVVSGGRWISSYQMPLQFKRIATGEILGINNLVVIAVGIYLIAAYFIRHTRTGRRLYAVGSNPEAALISGLPKRRLVFLAYTIMGSLSGLAGVLWVARFASAQGDTAMGYELQVIAACVLGGVSISGGVGRLSGLILGTILLGILNNALPLINVSPFWQMGIQGVTMLGAVVMNVLFRRRTERTALRKRPV
ncbi:MAG: ABC transporter permease [Spirochaetales bacterium]